MTHAHRKSAPARRATNVSLRADLVDEARALGLNLSKELETRLETLVNERRAARWKEENRGALAAYEKYFDKHGIWNEDLRGW